MGLINVKEKIKVGSVTAIIPAKLTSVRLPQKNIADFCGYPLFYYSIKAAQLCDSVSEVHVTSESDEVLSLSKKYEVGTIKRPENLSRPEVTNVEVLIHALEQNCKASGKLPEFIVLLQPTHPLRFPSDIEKGIQMMKDDPEADCLMTVVRDDRLSGEVKSNRFLSKYPLPRNKALEPKMFINTGSFYIFRTATTIAKRKMFTENILPLVIGTPEFEIDIDYEGQLIQARAIIEANKDVFSFFWN